MQIVIDIPKDVYEDTLKHSTEIQAKGYIIAGAVLHGTPLPKGHGRLIDADATIKEFGEWTDEWDDFAIGCLKSADTIIEADKVDI